VLVAWLRAVYGGYGWLHMSAGDELFMRHLLRRETDVLLSEVVYIRAYTQRQER
jgi:hypothetical protein